MWVVSRRCSGAIFRTCLVKAIRLAARPRHARVALPAAEATSAKLGVRVHMAPVRTTEDLREAFASMAREGADGVFVMASSFTRSNAAILAELALKHQLPNMFGTRENVEAGGFMSYARRRLHR